MACHSAVIPLCILCVCASVCVCELETESIVSAPLCVCFNSFAFCTHHCWASLSHYCSISQSSPTCSFAFSSGRLVRAKRLVVAANPTEYEYTESSIPMEWEGKSGLQHHSHILLLSLTWINDSVDRRITQQSTWSVAQIKWNNKFMAASIGASANPLIFFFFFFILQDGGWEKHFHEFIKDTFCWCYTTVP